MATRATNLGEKSMLEMCHNGAQNEDLNILKRVLTQHPMLLKPLKHSLKCVLTNISMIRLNLSCESRDCLSKHWFDRWITDTQNNR